MSKTPYRRLLMYEIYFYHMQRQDVNDLVANIQQTVQKIIDEMHEYLRGFVFYTIRRI